MPVSDSEITSFFTQSLMQWFAGHHRPLPWKDVKDPYLIWLSEIILQQTRVAQGLPYFERFRTHFPTVHDLAAASEDEVLKLWEGLGYYSRARNLHATAKRISLEMDGRFPETYQGLLDLKGVGPYTAAAIASFAFNLPHAVVDGNVYRVLARYFGQSMPVDSTKGKKWFAEKAKEVLDVAQPGNFNQAIMDFGATACTPLRPDCQACPLATHCQAWQEGAIDQYPVKQNRLKKRSRYFHFLVLDFEGQVLIRKRTGKDVWKGLYDFPLVEQDDLQVQKETLTDLLQELEWLPAGKASLQRVSKPFRQTLSHQQVHAVFAEVQLQQFPELPEGDLLFVNRENLRKFAFPKIIDWYLNDKSLYLNL